jgi:hypothetical protein
MGASTLNNKIIDFSFREIVFTEDWLAKQGLLLV